MKELVSPAQSETLVTLASLLLVVICGFSGYRALGARGLIAALVGPLVYVLWQAHKYVTRYDPQTGYFGLDKVRVLIVEIIVFVLIGCIAGWLWSQMAVGQMARKNETINHLPEGEK